MRLRERDLRPVNIRARTPGADDEGSVLEGYGVAYEVKASVQPLSGSAAAASYGENIKYMLSMRVNDLGSIKEKDGVCVNVAADADPDYEVDTIKTWDVRALELK